MKLFAALLALPLLCLPCMAQPQTEPAKTTVPDGGLVEVVFVLDTTSSMTGLLEGAKQKIWSIANEIVTAKPTPLVKIGFVAYRDKGDAYVTQVHDLTANIDGAFATLQTFQAQGGGDGPEHVNKGLNDAVHQIKWSDAAKVGQSLYQVMFLVGDWPPHMDYDDGFDYKKHSKEAIARGITINTVRCGPNPQTEQVWQEIARIGEGKYFSIAQNGGVISVATPYDAEISKIADKIEATTIAGGTSHARQAQRASYTANAIGAAGPPGPQGERALFNAKSSQGYGSWDLVTGQMNKTLDVTKMKDEELPEELRKLKPEERLQIINSKIEERKTAQANLEKLQRQRLDFIKDYSTKNKLDDKNAFDTLVKQALREQAARRNIRFQN